MPGHPQRRQNALDLNSPQRKIKDFIVALLCFLTLSPVIKLQFRDLHCEVSFSTCPLLSQQRASSKAVSS